ncbi:MAG: GDP-L-fucose synthase [Pseudonocardia sp.]|nr:GDP-L-fucose synthase [Pseudonocardia sp.]
MPEIAPLDRGSRVYVAGHHGLAGGAVSRALRAAGFHDLVGARSSELDLRERTATFAYLRDAAPDVVVLAAARVGGIVANDTFPAQFLSDNLRIQLSVMDAALELKVPRLLFLGSSCIYPRNAEQPISESALLTGPLESTNDAYAIAKIAGMVAVQATRRQFGLAWISATPSNLYGPGDTFHPEHSHVLPAMLHRFHTAVRDGVDEVVLWGTGMPRREFLHCDDLGRAVVALLDTYDRAEHVNIGVGHDLEIRELARHIAAVVGFTGRITWDTARPDGVPRKLLDVTRISSLGWRPQIELVDGIRQTYEWYRDHVATSTR